MDITKNQLVMVNNEVVRVLYIDKLSAITYVIDMEAFKWPYLVPLEVVIEASQKYESINIEESAYIRLFLEESLTTSQLKKREKAWEVVNFITSQLNGVEIYIHKYRAPVLKQAEQIFKVGNKTLKKYLLMYWKGAGTKNSLLPFYDKCGGKGQEKKVGSKKIGRPRQLLERQGINVDENIKRIFKKGLNSYYYNERKNSLKTTYELIIKEHFSSQIRDKSGKQVLVLEQKLPTYEQFLYWYRKNRDIKKEVSTRGSSKEFYQRNRAIIGNSIQDSGLGPANLFQIDSTIFDCYLVSMLNRNIIVGRPVLYTVMDVYSRVITGINVTFESFNGYVGAMIALENAMTDKVSYCKKYGIDIQENEWPSAIPNRIMADRGELENGQIENAIANLGISIQNTPPYRADYKGIIESAFKQLNIKIKPFADGVVTNSKNVLERGEKDYRLKANLNLHEFTQIVIKTVLFHNNNHVLSEYVTNEMQIEDSIEKIPIKIWEHGIKTTKGQLRTLPAEIIKLNLYPTAQASVTAKGVYFNKMYYLSANLLKSNDFAKARTGGSWKVTVSYDPRDLTTIFLLSDDKKSFEELTLVEYLSKFKSMAIEDINSVLTDEEIRTKQGKEQELQAKINLFSEIESIVVGAREEAGAEQDTNASKTSRLKGIKDNLRQEREIERKQIREKVIESDSQNDDYLSMYREIQ